MTRQPLCPDVTSNAVVELIHSVRGHRVILDADIAPLYGVETRVLVQGVKRNIKKFPPHFMFQLTQDEARALRSQSVILNDIQPATGRGKHPKYLPYAFTEHGALQLSNVLRSDRAIQVSIAVVEAFVRLRQILSSHVELGQRLDALERQYDSNFKQVFDAIRELMRDTTKLKNKLTDRSLPEKKRRRVGFKDEDEN
jgi:hypothetical protein